MYKEDLKIHYKGFHPNDFTKTFIQKIFSDLHEESPADSTLKADICKKDGVFKAVLSIYSSVGKFFAVASGKNLHEVTDKILHQIRRQIDRWKTVRFDHRRLKDIHWTHGQNNFSEEKPNNDYDRVS